MRILDTKRAALAEFARRSEDMFDEAAADTVRDIVAAVRRDGDDALRALTERFDGVRLASFQVPASEVAAAEAALPPALAAAIRLSAERIERFHRQQPSSGFLAQEAGGVLGQLVRPLSSVACYVPGGTAPLFSSLLMTAVPARVAGVGRVVAATPPRPDGTVAPEILFAASVAGVDAVYRIGGAQAIAALAYGTNAVEAVDKIVGPGNRFVVLAKRQVFGTVGIESLPGPTETLVVADASADPRHVVADLLAQAEHLGAQPVLVTPSRSLVDAVLAALEPAVTSLPTAPAARESLDRRGLICLVADLDEALEVANAYAPEHLCLLTAEPWELLPHVVNAGGVFLGRNSLEALGDYVAGPSHVMPTAGTARYASAVNVRDFQKVIPLVALGKELVDDIGPSAVLMARAEGLEAHARAVEARLIAGTDEEAAGVRQA